MQASQRKEPGPQTWEGTHFTAGGSVTQHAGRPGGGKGPGEFQKFRWLAGTGEEAEVEAEATGGLDCSDGTDRTGRTRRGATGARATPRGQSKEGQEGLEGLRDLLLPVLLSEPQFPPSEFPISPISGKFRVPDLRSPECSDSNWLGPHDQRFLLASFPCGLPPALLCGHCSRRKQGPGPGLQLLS